MRDKALMQIQIAGIDDDSVVDGDGCRLTIFVQGCSRRCRNCQNPTAQPFNGGVSMDTSDIIRRIKENPLLNGVTFSGGEPFCQCAPLCEIAAAAHDMGLDVWSYTGNTYEELQNSADKNVHRLLDEVDVLVDGEYRDELRDLSLKFRGSSNQRVIDMQKTRSARSVVLKYK